MRKERTLRTLSRLSMRIIFGSMLAIASILPLSAAGTSKHVERVLYSFCAHQDCTDGNDPVGGLLHIGGSLYGTTLAGGLAGCNGSGCGVAFSIDAKTGAEKTIYSFCSQQNCEDGSIPFASLIVVKGTLYGTT